MTLHQIVRHEGTIDRVPRGRTPVVQLDLKPGDRIISCELREVEMWGRSQLDRKTVDWKYVVYIDWSSDGDPA